MQWKKNWGPPRLAKEMGFTSSDIKWTKKCSFDRKISSNTIEENRAHHHTIRSLRKVRSHSLKSSTPHFLVIGKDPVIFYYEKEMVIDHKRSNGQQYWDKVNTAAHEPGQVSPPHIIALGNLRSTFHRDKMRRSTLPYTTWWKCTKNMRSNVDHKIREDKGCGVT